MLRPNDCKVIFTAVGLTGVLLLASPTLSLFLHLPNSEGFSEIWILGPEGMAENYPLNTKTNETYKFFVGVGNHMGCSSYYIVYVKFRNQTEPLPDNENGVPSPLPPLLGYRAFLHDGECWKREVAFSFSKILSEGNASRVEYLKADGTSFLMNKIAEWNHENSGHYYHLFFELWRYNPASGSFQYHKRFVGLWLNTTM